MTDGKICSTCMLPDDDHGCGCPICHCGETDPYEQAKCSQKGCGMPHPETAPMDDVGYGCDHCGRAILIDAVLPDEVWRRISPTGDEAGLLCAACIADRLAAALCLTRIDMIPGSKDQPPPAGHFGPHREHDRRDG